MRAAPHPKKRCHPEDPEHAGVILVRDDGAYLRPGGALDPSAVSGGPPETSRCAWIRRGLAEVWRRLTKSPLLSRFRRVAESGTRVECSTRSCTGAFFPSSLTRECLSSRCHVRR